MQPLRIVFAGTPEFAVPTLQALIASGHSLVGIYTQPDRPAGRGQKLRASPVKEVALAHQLDVFQPVSLKPAAEAQSLQLLKPDLMVVVAYGLLLPEAVLSIPTQGCINVHGSLLPRWRGAAPIQRAILAGDAQTGVTIMQMDKGLDTGDMLALHRCAIEPADTSATLQVKLAALGAQTLMQVLPLIGTYELHPEKQQEALATYAHKIQKSEAQIDWTQSARQIANKIRAFNPWPVAQTLFKQEVLRIWEAAADSRQSTERAGIVFARDAEQFWVATGEGSVRVSRVQMPGKKPTSVHDFLNAYDIQDVQLVCDGGSLS